MRFLQISIFEKDNKLRCFSCKFELEGLGEVEMKEFNISSETIQKLEKELTMQIMQRLGRDFGEVFNENKTIHSNGYQAQEVLPVQEQGSAPMADMLRQQPISSDMP